MRVCGYLLLAILLSVLLSPCSALCNGVYIPQVAIEKMPAIPVQRALITYRDGVETLVVESDLQTQASNVGWILPLPQQPTSVGKGEPGMLVSATLALRADVVHDLHNRIAVPVAVLAFLALPLLAVLFTREPGLRSHRFIEYLALSMFLFLVFSIMLPGLARVDQMAAGATTVLSSQRVGNYTVDILAADSADDLQSWLQQNQLHDLSVPARNLIDDYIARGWCFAVARLEVTPDAVTTPHPLAFTFPTTTPIFPMKLTALAGTKTRVELIVVADRGAQADGFHLTCSDQFRTLSFESTSSSGLVLANPDVAKHLWNNCIVSKLQADLDPAAMAQDVTIEMVPFTPHRDRLYTTRAGSQIIASIFLWALLPASVIMAFACAGLRRPSRTTTRIALALLACAALTSVAFAATVEVRSDVTVQRSGRFAEILTRSRLIAAITHQGLPLYADDPDLAAKVIGAIQADPDARQNEYQGGDRRWERSPGNIYLTDHRQLAYYNLDTRPITISDPLPFRTTHPPSSAAASQP